MPAADRRRPAGVLLGKAVGLDQHLRDRVDRRRHEGHMPAPRSQRDRDVLGVHRRCAEQEHRRRRRLLDHLEQRIRGAFRQSVGILDHHHLPSPGTRPPRGDLHDAAHLVHADGQALGDDPPHVGVGARHGGGAGAAFAATGHAVAGALQRSREAQRGDRSTRPGWPGDQPRMCHGPDRGRIVSRITACSLRGGHQLGFHGVLAHQTRKDTGHHR